MNNEIFIRVGLDALSKLTYLKSGDTFTIQQLFDPTLWNFIPNQYKFSFDNMFYNYVKNNKMKDIQVQSRSKNNYIYIKN